MSTVDPNFSFHQVQQGYFDILFPTEFAVVEDIYRHITGNSTRVHTQEDFLRNWAKIEKTRTRSGENPLLGWYANASVMTTLPDSKPGSGALPLS